MLITAVTQAQSSVSGYTTELIGPGTTPDNFLYFLDVAMDNLALAATFNTDDRVNKSLEIAEERLAEAKAMAEKGDYEAMQKAEEEHIKVMSQLKGEVSGLQDVDPEKALEEKLKADVKLKQYGDKLDEIDVTMKGNLTEEQKAYFVAMLQDFKNQTHDVKQNIMNELNDTREKLGKNASEIEDNIRQQQGIVDFEKERAVNMREKAVDKWAEVVEKAARYNVTAPDRSNFDVLLASGDALMANRSYEEAKETYEVAKDYAEDIKKIIENMQGKDGPNLIDSNKARFEAEEKWSEVMEKAIKSHVAVPDRAEFDALLAKGDTLMFQGLFEEAIDAYERAKDYAENVNVNIEKGNDSPEKEG